PLLPALRYAAFCIRRQSRWIPGAGGEPALRARRGPGCSDTAEIRWRVTLEAIFRCGPQRSGPACGHTADVTPCQDAAMHETPERRTRSAADPIFFGWRVVAAAFVIAVFAWGIGFYGPPIFLGVLQVSRGWPLALISAAISVHFLCGAAVVAALDALHRRYGVAATTGAGALVAAIGLLGWGYAREPWQLFVAVLFSGAGWAMTSGAALNAMVSPWFERRRPAALGMAFNGASLGGVVFSPLWVALIAWLGFGAAVLVVAAAMVATIWWLAWRYLALTPAALGQSPDGGEAGGPARAPAVATATRAGPLASPWRDARFRTLIAAASLGLFAQVGLV